MSGRSCDLIFHGRPKSAWSNAKRRQSLAFESLKSDDLNKLSLNKLTFDEPKRHKAKQISKTGLKRESSLNSELFRLADDVMRGADYDSLDEEIEAFNRSKQRTSKDGLLGGREFESQDVTWDSLDEEIEAFNRERSIKSDEGRRRNSARLSVSDNFDIGEDGVIVIEEITSLQSNKEECSSEVTRSEVKQDRQGIHVVAKRSNSDKGPGATEKSKIGRSQTQKIGDLLTFDLEVAKKNVLERYNFYRRIDKMMNEADEEKKEISKEIDSPSNHVIRSKKKMSTLDLINNERPKVKLKPLKIRPNQPIGGGVEIPSNDNRNKKSTLLQCLPNRLTNSTNIQHSSPDLSRNSFQLDSNKPSNQVVIPIDNKNESTFDEINRLKSIDDDQFQPDTDRYHKKNKKKSTHLLNFDPQPGDWNNESPREKDSNNLQPTTDLTGFQSIDWNNQSLADFWLQTKKDLGSF